MVSQLPDQSPDQSPGQSPERAPLDPAELEKSLRPFGQSRMLPRDAYTSEAVFEWEQRNFFEAGWICLGRSSIVADVGDQRAEALGRGSVLLMRAKDGTARAFANACRHRGHELLPCGETVNRPIVLCPYHAWSYRLDGRLRKAPGFDRRVPLRPARERPRRAAVRGVARSVVRGRLRGGRAVRGPRRRARGRRRPLRASSGSSRRAATTTSCHPTGRS